MFHVNIKYLHQSGSELGNLFVEILLVIFKIVEASVLLLESRILCQVFGKIYLQFLISSMESQGMRILNRFKKERKEGGTPNSVEGTSMNLKGRKVRRSK